MILIWQLVCNVLIQLFRKARMPWLVELFSEPGTSRTWNTSDLPPLVLPQGADVNVHVYHGVEAPPCVKEVPEPTIEWLWVVDGHTTVLGPGDYFVGALPGATLLLSHREVSGRHAFLYLSLTDAWIVDLGSTNATWVNQNKITERTPLGESSELRFGPVEVALHLKKRTSESGLEHTTYAS